MGFTRYRKEDVGPPLLALSFHAPKRIGLAVGRGPCRNSTFSYTLTYVSGVTGGHSWGLHKRLLRSAAINILFERGVLRPGKRIKFGQLWDYLTSSAPLAINWSLSSWKRVSSRSPSMTLSATESHWGVSSSGDRQCPLILPHWCRTKRIYHRANDLFASNSPRLSSLSSHSCRISGGTVSRCVANMGCVPSESCRASQSCYYPHPPLHRVSCRSIFQPAVPASQRYPHVMPLQPPADEKLLPIKRHYACILAEPISIHPTTQPRHRDQSVQ